MLRHKFLFATKLPSTATEMQFILLQKDISDFLHPLNGFNVGENIIKWATIIE